MGWSMYLDIRSGTSVCVTESTYVNDGKISTVVALLELWSVVACSGVRFDAETIMRWIRC